MDDFKYHMTEFKCLKAVFILNFLKLITEPCALNNLLCYYTKNDVPRKSEEDVMINFVNPRKGSVTELV